MAIGQMNPLPAEALRELSLGVLDAALLTQEVRALWSDGMKVNAIKRYREETGAGLKESKQAVEAMCADIVIDGGIEPESHPAQTVRNTGGLCPVHQSLRYRNRSFDTFLKCLCFSYRQRPPHLGSAQSRRSILKRDDDG